MCVLKNTWLPCEGEAGRCYFGGSHCIVIMSSSESGFVSQESCSAVKADDHNKETLTLL